MSERSVVHDAELNILARVVQVQDFESSLFRGMRGDYFQDATYGKVWEYVRAHHNDYGKVPDQTTVLKDFPELKDYLLRARPVEPAEFYADHILETYSRRGIAEKLVKSIPLLEANVNEGIDKVSSILSEYRVIRNQTNVLTLANTGRERLDDYRTALVYGVQFGWETLDRLTLGAHPGDLGIFIARPGLGKAQPLTEPVLTPGGWKTMGDIRQGDKVVGADGKPTTVLGVYPQGVRPTYRVHFDDGTYVDCDEEHLWLTKTRHERRYGKDASVKTTREISDTLRITADQRANHSVQINDPVEHPHKDLPLDPYIMGVLLGDGSFRPQGRENRVSLPDPFIKEVFEDALPAGTLTHTSNSDYRINVGPGAVVQDTLEKYGLNDKYSHEKYIPNDYLYASVEQRVELLQGLCDSDGYSKGTAAGLELTSSSQVLANQFLALVRSLGGRGSMIVKEEPHYRDIDGEKVICRPSYRVNATFPEGGIIPFKLPRKRDTFKPRTRAYSKFITNVEYIGESEMQCIMVAAEDSLYITRDYNVTHNTWMMLKNSHTAWQDDRRVLVIATEVPATKMLTRLDAIHLGVNYDLFKQHMLTDDQEAAYEKFLLEEHEANDRYHIVDGTGMTPSSLGVLVEHTKPDIVYIDSVHKLEPDGAYRERWHKMANLANELKDRVAQRYKIPVICNMHFNRDVGSTHGNGKNLEGGLESIAGGDEWGKVADLAVSISRNEVDAGENRLKMRVIKGREVEEGRAFYVNFKFDRMDFSERPYEEPTEAESTGDDKKPSAAGW